MTKLLICLVMLPAILAADFYGGANYDSAYYYQDQGYGYYGAGYENWNVNEFNDPHYYYDAYDNQYDPAASLYESNRDGIDFYYHYAPDYHDPFR